MYVANSTYETPKDRRTLECEIVKAANGSRWFEINIDLNGRREQTISVFPTASMNLDIILETIETAIRGYWQESDESNGQDMTEPTAAEIDAEDRKRDRLYFIPDAGDERDSTSHNEILLTPDPKPVEAETIRLAYKDADFHS